MFFFVAAAGNSLRGIVISLVSKMCFLRETSIILFLGQVNIFFETKCSPFYVYIVYGICL